jgi:hypothetical protein
MEAEHRPDDTPVDRPTEIPVDPTPDRPDAAGHKPNPPFFKRLAFLNKDTGRWHKFAGGRGRRDDGSADS